MRRIPRFERSFDLLHSRSVSAASVPYICSVCRLQTTSFSTSQASQAKVSVAERLRQKIWGTSAPPGQEDPYGGPSTIEKNKAAKKASKARKAPTSQEPRPTPKPYKRATTWEALEEFGLQEPEPLQLNSFVPAEVITDGFEITTCLHRAMVEVFACSQAGRPLSDVWRMEPTVDQTHKIQIKPSETGVQLEFPDSMTSQQLLASLSPMALEEQTETLADETTSEEVIVESQQLEGGNSVQSKDVEEVSVKAQEDIKESVADTQPDDGPASAASLTYLDVVESWGPSWLQISLYEPDIKFAVSTYTSPYQAGSSNFLPGLKADDAVDRHSHQGLRDSRYQHSSQPLENPYTTP